MDWEAFRKEIRNCTFCPLHLTRKHALPGEGNIHAKIFMIAQAPGPVEDQSGRMFTGPSAPHLDHLLAIAGLDRKQIYITNLIKCFLPKCRRPSRTEIDACSPYLLREMEAVNPGLIVPLGFHATRFLLMYFNLPRPEKKKFHLLFGHVFQAGRYTVYPLRHPTALLFDPPKKPVMEENYRKLGDFIDNNLKA
ncbi:MAG TPA: uracil-DNA glycosylase [Bacteroidetes bacterium]|nr:uracil-DNA glycosylase [Bacteroidota bacterium]